MRILDSLSVSFLHQPLPLELCQRIHYDALWFVVDGNGVEPADEVPSNLSVIELRHRVRWFGHSALLLHPSELQRLFKSITLADYQVIERLYCNRLARSVKMVWRILNAQRAQSEQSALNYEAVWAICIFLRLRRVRSVEVVTEHLDTPWILTNFQPDVMVYARLTTVYAPTVVCIIDIQHPRVLALRISRDEQLTDDIALAMYHAIVAQRRPKRHASGIVWRLPYRLLVEPELVNRQVGVYTSLGIEVTPEKLTFPLLSTLRGDWTRDIPKQPLRVEEFSRICDRYLYNVHGYGPLSMHDQQDRQFRHRNAYKRDPASQFPALRMLLPEVNSRVADDGSVAVNDLHYIHELLHHWRGSTVAARLSAESASRAWIYLNGEVLCLARARELRRPDGSYWKHRPWR